MADNENKSIETEGRTPQEAIRKALETLGVGRDEVEITILSEEQKGLFGLIGARAAKIRATLKKKIDKKQGNF